MMIKLSNDREVRMWRTRKGLKRDAFLLIFKNKRKLRKIKISEEALKAVLELYLINFIEDAMLGLK